jgi:hypothetical protein
MHWPLATSFESVHSLPEPEAPFLSGSTQAEQRGLHGVPVQRALHGVPVLLAMNG